MGTPRKINAILLNIKINRPQLVNMCGYKLASNWQNFLEINLAWVKMSQKILKGYIFYLHCTRTVSPYAGRREKIQIKLVIIPYGIMRNLIIYATNSTDRYFVDAVLHKIHRHDVIRRVPGCVAMVLVQVLDLSISVGRP